MKDKVILIIDDDPFIGHLIEEILEKEGAVTYKASDGNEGLRIFYKRQPDLVILDVMMPQMSGWEVCRQIRQLSETPIMMLTSLSSDSDEIRGFDCGAIDYVTKPFSSNVLSARIRSALRRSTTQETMDDEIVYEDQYLTVDIKKHTVFVQNQPVKLTQREFAVLAYLATNAGQVCTFEQILDKVWGWEYQNSIEYVHVYISRLRKKIEPKYEQARYLQTEHGLGYRFMPQN